MPFFSTSPLCPDVAVEQNNHAQNHFGLDLANVEAQRMLALSEVKASFELRREEQVAEATKKGNEWQQGWGDVRRS